MVTDTLARVSTEVDALAGVDWAGLTVPEQLKALEAMETVSRKLRAVSGSLMANLAQEPVDTLGDKVNNAIGNAIRISPAEAGRRIKVAAAMEPSVSLTGAPIPAPLQNSSPRWHAGLLDPEHVKVITNLLDQLPASVGFDQRQWAEAELAAHAEQLRPDQLASLASVIAAGLNPDGDFSDAERARKRALRIGRQHADGMSPVSGWITPELRAALEAVMAKLAAPGACNPADSTPHMPEIHPEGEGQHQAASDQATEIPSDEATAIAPDKVAEAPSGEQPETPEQEQPVPEHAGARTQLDEAVVADAARDSRTHEQRQHDAMLAICRMLLCSGNLGSHAGLPVTIIATTTLDQLESAAGHAITADGTRLPMRDLIRMASHAYHYLSVFDRHSEIPMYLGRTRRTASVGQRIMLHAAIRGCSFPGCTAPAYQCEVDHIDEWGPGGPTNIDVLTLACKPHHRLHTFHGWNVRMTPRGRTQWVPPPQLTLPHDGTNSHHRPEDYRPPGR